MRKSKFTESQIVGILAEGESGLAVGDVCRKHGISNATYYQWKSKYAVYGMPMRSYVDKLVSDGVTPILMGCLVGGAGSPFWRGYNAYMESKFPMLEPVLTLGVLGRS